MNERPSTKPLIYPQTISRMSVQFRSISDSQYLLILSRRLPPPPSSTSGGSAMDTLVLPPSEWAGRIGLSRIDRSGVMIPSLPPGSGSLFGRMKDCWDSTMDAVVKKVFILVCVLACLLGSKANVVHVGSLARQVVYTVNKKAGPQALILGKESCHFCRPMPCFISDVQPRTSAFSGRQW